MSPVVAKLKSRMGLKGATKPGDLIGRMNDVKAGKAKLSRPVSKKAPVKKAVVAVIPAKKKPVVVAKAKAKVQIKPGKAIPKKIVKGLM